MGLELYVLNQSLPWGLDLIERMQNRWDWRLVCPLTQPYSGAWIHRDDTTSWDLVCVVSGADWLPTDVSSLRRQDIIELMGLARTASPTESIKPVHVAQYIFSIAPYA